MEKLTIAETKSTPLVHFDPTAHILAVTGQSYPENAFKFYEPVLAWVDEYLGGLGDDAAVTVELRLQYINTSSTKCFIMLLEKFEEAYRSGRDIRIHWYYHPDNDSELECAEEFKEDLSLPFHIVPKSE